MSQRKQFNGSAFVEPSGNLNGDRFPGVDISDGGVFMVTHPRTGKPVKLLDYQVELASRAMMARDEAALFKTIENPMDYIEKLQAQIISAGGVPRSLLIAPQHGIQHINVTLEFERAVEADCECRKERFGFMTHERWCPDWVDPMGEPEAEDEPAERGSFETWGDHVSAWGASQASGAELDNIGKLVGFHRQLETDAEFRQRLQLNMREVRRP